LLFSLIWGAFCLQFVNVSLNFNTLKLNWVTKIGIFRISGINLSHLGADLSILAANTPKKKIKKKCFLIWVLIWACANSEGR
jgi:hypothetical protein